MSAPESAPQSTFLESALEPIAISSGEHVTLNDGSTFCINQKNLNIDSVGAQGVFFEDARFLSSWNLEINNSPIELLSAVQQEAHRVDLVGRIHPHGTRKESTAAVLLSRSLEKGVHHKIRIRNYSDIDTTFELALSLDADFLHIFDVRSGRSAVRGTKTRSTTDSCVQIRHQDEDLNRGINVHFNKPFRVEQDRIVLETEIERGEFWETDVSIRFVIDDEEIEPHSWATESREQVTPTVRAKQWRQHIPLILSDNRTLERAVQRCNDDLGRLRIFDPRLSTYPVVAAGSPWFLTLFGRDSLLTSYMSLIVDPDIAIGTIDALARLQGSQIDTDTQEEPGKILHELRRAPSNKLGFNKSNIYYGSSDATPLFVMLVGELRRWGLAPSLVDRFMPHVDRAMEWIECFGDLDGDGYIESVPRTEHDITFYPAWKDAPSSIRYANGNLPDGPVALAEQQAYIYGAYHARMWFAREAGDTATAEKYQAKARALKQAFNEDFWVENGEYFAIGIDSDKKPVDSLASNMGHCLWTGLIDEDKADAIRKHLVSPELFSGWGVRTLASNMVGYNPVGYQNGAVWPHDTIICAAGLRRYGFLEDSMRLVSAVLESTIATMGSPPELFSGFDRDVLSVPVAYPTSCTPQAWSAASVLMALRLIIGLDPAVPQGRIHLAPADGDYLKYLRLERVPMNGRRVAIEIEGGRCHVENLDSDLEVITTPRDAVADPVNT